MEENNIETSPADIKLSGYKAENIILLELFSNDLSQSLYYF
jgi:hypothetical protein